MEFRIGQKYRITDISQWSDDGIYYGYSRTPSKFKNGDIIEVGESSGGYLHFELSSDKTKSSDHLTALRRYGREIEGIELVEDNTDKTLPIYHIADVLEDALLEDDMGKVLEMIELCIKSLRKAGY